MRYIKCSKCQQWKDGCWTAMKDTACVSLSQNMMNLTQRGNQTLPLVCAWVPDVAKETSSWRQKQLLCRSEGLHSWKCKFSSCFQLEDYVFLHVQKKTQKWIHRFLSVSLGIMWDIWNWLRSSPHASMWFFLPKAWPAVTVNGAAWLDRDQEVFRKVINIWSSLEHFGRSVVLRDQQNLTGTDFLPHNCSVNLWDLFFIPGFWC